MSENELEEMTRRFEQSDAKHAKRARQEFIARMERKLHHKEKLSRY